ncbi:hypothetical protein [Polyangium fumosum]|uniref:Cytochrome C Planctomycete-type domain-containing protein n=1 Tax=Polyangium fumosum TaxID=889272 RepID=A0A4U1IVQ7_9BACT|nr:hypothetical protein [Polyangium fumosum]TKC98597.1 hypothetical protein E8A74_40730 [Polyangium fumosum]
MGCGDQDGEIKPDDSGGSGGGGAGGGDTAVDPAAAVYPDVTTLHALGVMRTCALNEGVCHHARQYPELGAVSDMLALVNAPCQVSPADPSLVPEECERPGDKLVLGGMDLEILRVIVPSDAPFPPVSVELSLGAAPPSLDVMGARIRRLDDGGAEVKSVPLDGAAVGPGSDATSVKIELGGAPIALRDFLDVRVVDQDHVRMGDPNGNGIAHGTPAPWSQVHPGDPKRSYLYRRLLDDQYGPRMPLIPRTWSPLATRALFCWVRGLPEGATPDSPEALAPIDYASCPLDPDAPDPNATGAWSSVRTLMGSRCATQGCHTEAARAGGLDLTPTSATFVKDVISVASTQQPSVLRVVPGQPAASYLLCKVDPACESRAPMTALMPSAGESLTEMEIMSIRTWILNGAPLE